jgi:pimeloyl-ACP methyl ester carboxylesterase
MTMLETTEDKAKATGSLPGRKIEVNGVRYHVADHGDGDRVVLLLHGMPDTSSSWRHQVEALVDAGYRAIVPDMLGYGETDKPGEVARYNGEKILGDILALLDALEISRTDIIGHDWGAYVSWELAINFPERFRRHIALSIGHPDSVLRARSIEEVKDNWYMYLNTMDAVEDLYACNDGAWLREIFLPTHPEIDEVWSRMKDPLAMRSMLAWDRANPMSALYLAASQGQVPARACTVPTLGIWSAGDTYLSESQMKASSESMSAPWRYARIDHGSHWMQLDQPNEVNALVLNWLDQD